MQIEAVERLPDLTHQGLQDVIVPSPLPLPTSRNVSCGVGCSTSGTNRSGAVSVSPPKPTSAMYGPGADPFNLQQHVTAGADGPVGRIPRHAGGKSRDPEAQILQDIAQQQILLEAPAAAPRAKHLAFERLGLEADGPLQQRIEVFERDSLRMAQVNAG